MLWLQRRDVVRLATAGAGGYGDPFERDPERVLDDCRQGLVSEAAAAADYGVVIRDGAVDANATAVRRSGPRPDKAQGAERARWESVFTAAGMDRFAAALACQALVSRQSLRRAVFAAALDPLPKGFPAAEASEEALAAACAKLDQGVAGLAPATAGV